MTGCPVAAKKRVASVASWRPTHTGRRPETTRPTSALPQREPGDDDDGDRSGDDVDSTDRTVQFKPGGSARASSGEIGNS